jgi:hypothetical protein
MRTNLQRKFGAGKRFNQRFPRLPKLLTRIRSKRFYRDDVRVNVTDGKRRKVTTFAGRMLCFLIFYIVRPFRFSGCEKELLYFSLSALPAS